MIITYNILVKPDLVMSNINVDASVLFYRSVLFLTSVFVLVTLIIILVSPFVVRDEISNILIRYASRTAMNNNNRLDLEALRMFS